MLLAPVEHLACVALRAVGDGVVLGVALDLGRGLAGQLRADGAPAHGVHGLAGVVELHHADPLDAADSAAVGLAVDAGRDLVLGHLGGEVRRRGVGGPAVGFELGRILCTVANVRGLHRGRRWHLRHISGRGRGGRRGGGLPDDLDRLARRGGRRKLDGPRPVVASGELIHRSDASVDGALRLLDAEHPELHQLLVGRLAVGAREQPAQLRPLLVDQPAGVLVETPVVPVVVALPGAGEAGRPAGPPRLLVGREAGRRLGEQQGQGYAAGPDEARVAGLIQRLEAAEVEAGRAERHPARAEEDAVHAELSAHALKHPLHPARVAGHLLVVVLHLGDVGARPVGRALVAIPLALVGAQGRPAPLELADARPLQPRPDPAHGARGHTVAVELQHPRPVDVLRAPAADAVDLVHDRQAAPAIAGPVPASDDAQFPAVVDLQRAQLADAVGVQRLRQGRRVRPLVGHHQGAAAAEQASPLRRALERQADAQVGPQLAQRGLVLRVVLHHDTGDMLPDRRDVHQACADRRDVQAQELPGVERRGRQVRRPVGRGRVRRGAGAGRVVDQAAQELRALGIAAQHALHVRVAEHRRDLLLRGAAGLG